MADYSKIKFLVADDMLTMRKIVSGLLRELGATDITEAENGAVAWDMMVKAAAENAPFQFVVSDWNMPKMRGLDLLKKCRSTAPYQHVAFLLVTAEAEVGQVTEAVLSGVDNYIVKPLAPNTFEQKLAAVYAKRFPAR